MIYYTRLIPLQSMIKLQHTEDFWLTTHYISLYLISFNHPPITVLRILTQCGTRSRLYQISVWYLSIGSVDKLLYFVESGVEIGRCDEVWCSSCGWGRRWTGRGILSRCAHSYQLALLNQIVTLSAAEPHVGIHQWRPHLFHLTIIHSQQIHSTWWDRKIIVLYF